MQMLLGAVLIHALHTALEYAEIAFNGVCVNLAIRQAYILASAVIDAFMNAKIEAWRS